MPDGGSKMETNQSNLKSPSFFLAGPPLVAETAPHPELLASLGRLVRGLSLLFWGLPLALVVCVQTAKGDWFRSLGAFPSLASTALLFYGLNLLGHFQKQERPWRAALERVQIVALINVGPSPFLYWSNRIPAQPFFTGVVEALMLTGLLFLLLLNPMLCRLTSMLPDETLRLETRLFTAANRYLLLAILIGLAAYFTVVHIDPALPAKAESWLFEASPVPAQGNALLYFLDRAKDLFLLLFILLPVAMTMALTWKIKEVILASVFGPDH